MRMLSLFAGIGGFDLAAEWAGYEVAGQDEIDPFCQKVLAQHWPDVMRIGNIHDVSGDEFGPVDLVTGGFPCQPVSVAGQRRGAGDDRWLWPEMARVIAAVRPTWVIGENTAGLVTMGLDGVLADLEGLGYACWTAIVPAIAVGALHRRDRVWVVAHANSGRELQPSGFEPRQRRRPLDGGLAFSREALADADGGRSQHRTRVDDAGKPDAAWRGAGTPPGRSSDADVRTGREAGGHAVTGVRRVADGLPKLVDRPEPARLTTRRDGRSSRLKALGNSIVPQVAYEFVRLTVSEVTR